MWIRSEFGVLYNLDQASEVSLSNGTIEARSNGEPCPLAHRSSEADALKVFDRIAQELAEGKRFLDLSKKPSGEAAHNSETVISPEAGGDEKAL